MRAELVLVIVGIVVHVSRLILAIREGWNNDWESDTFRGVDERTVTAKSWPRPSNDRRS